MLKKKLIALILSILLIAGSNANTYPSFALPNANGAEQIKVIVGFKSGLISSQSVKFAKIASQGGQVRQSFKLINAVSATMTADEAAMLAMDANVAYIEPDYPVHSLEQSTSWGVEKSFGGETYPFPIWQEASGAGIKVAVLDTGISGTHEDLNLSTVGVNCTAVGSFNVDIKAHGTHVAGIISAQDNSIGVVGLVPKISLHSVKVLDDSGGGNVSDVIEGLDWAVTNQMKIVNMSLGTSENSSSLEAACANAKAAGLLLVAAAGNEGVAGDNVLYPAKYTSVLAVSASDELNKIADFSSRGPEVDIIAPGANIYSTIPGLGGHISTGGITYLSSVLTGATLGAIDGQIVDCGTAKTEASVLEAISNAGISTTSAWIALIDRDAIGFGSTTFATKVSNAMTCGASGAVIVNSDSTNANDPGAFTLYSTTSDEAISWIPTIAVSTKSGVNIRLSLNAGASSKLGSLVVRENAAYAYNSGTSMAAPHVAGVAALLWSAQPTLTNNQISALLTGTAVDLGLSAAEQGAGLLRGDLALTKLYLDYPLAEAKNLTIAGFTVVDKLYDGTTNAVSGAGFSDNRDAGADLRFSFEANFDTKDVGANKPVSFTNITISGGADRYKYQLIQTTGSAFASISQAALMVKAKDLSKTIGDSDPTFTATYAGFALSESALDLGGSLAFTRQAGEAVGNYTITPAGLTSTNYALSFATGILTIKAKEIVIISDPPPSGGGGGGGGIILPPPVTIPVVTVPAIVLSLPTIRFNIGMTSLFQTSGTALETFLQMDVAPILYQNRTMLPIRYVAEPLGGSIAWDRLLQKITIIKGSTMIELWIGSNIAKINGIPTLIDGTNLNVKPIVLAPGRTMLPIRFISEALGCKVEWNKEKQEITVK
ncbi:MAG: S8 family serine peptidase [Clostridia bacterium]